MKLELLKVEEIKNNVRVNNYNTIETMYKLWIATFGGQIEFSGRLKKITNNKTKASEVVFDMSGRIGAPYVNESTKKVIYPIRMRWGYDDDLSDRMDYHMRKTMGEVLLRKVEKNDLSPRAEACSVNEFGEIVENPDYNRKISGKWLLSWQWPEKRSKEQLIKDVTREDYFRGFGTTIIREGKHCLAMHTILRPSKAGLRLEWPSYDLNNLRLQSMPEAANYVDLATGNLLEGITLNDLPNEIKYMVGRNGRIRRNLRDFVTCLTCAPAGHDDECECEGSVVYGRPIVCNPQIKEEVAKVVMDDVKSWNVEIKTLDYDEKAEEAAEGVE